MVGVLLLPAVTYAQTPPQTKAQEPNLSAEKRYQLSRECSEIVDKNYRAKYGERFTSHFNAVLYKCLALDKVTVYYGLKPDGKTPVEIQIEVPDDDSLPVQQFRQMVQSRLDEQKPEDHLTAFAAMISEFVYDAIEQKSISHLARTIRFLHLEPTMQWVYRTDANGEDHPYSQTAPAVVEFRNLMIK